MASVDGEVVVQMSIHAQRPHAQNRLRPLHAPAGNGDIHRLFDQMAASTHYDVAWQGWSGLLSVTTLWRAGPALSAGVVRATSSAAQGSARSAVNGPTAGLAAGHRGHRRWVGRSA